MSTESDNRYLARVSRKQLKALEDTCRYAWDLHNGHMLPTLVKWASVAYRRHYKERYKSEPDDMSAVTGKLFMLAKELKELGWETGALIDLRGDEIVEMINPIAEADSHYMLLQMAEDFRRGLRLKKNDIRKTGKVLSLKRFDDSKGKPFYLVEMSHGQLQFLSISCDSYARFICGQLDFSLQNEVEDAWEKRHAKSAPLQENGHPDYGIGTEEWYVVRHGAEDIINEIRSLCWHCSRCSSYGVRYSDDSDIVWDMYEVFRHQLWLVRPEDKKMNCTVDAFPAMQFGKEPLVRIGLVGE